MNKIQFRNSKNKSVVIPRGGGVRGWHRWMPIAPAVVPTTFVSVLLIVEGIGILSGLDSMVAALKVAWAESTRLINEIIFQIGSALILPVWGVALAVATLGYYFRRSDTSSVGGRNTSAVSNEYSTTLQ